MPDDDIDSFWDQVRAPREPDPEPDPTGIMNEIGIFPSEGFSRGDFVDLERRIADSRLRATRAEHDSDQRSWTETGRAAHQQLETSVREESLLHMARQIRTAIQELEISVPEETLRSILNTIRRLRAGIRSGSMRGDLNPADQMRLTRELSELEEMVRERLPQEEDLGFGLPTQGPPDTPSRQSMAIDSFRRVYGRPPAPREEGDPEDLISEEDSYRNELISDLTQAFANLGIHCSAEMVDVVGLSGQRLNVIFYDVPEGAIHWGAQRQNGPDRNVYFHITPSRRR